MIVKGDFKYFIDGKEVLYKDLQTKIKLDMTVEVDGLNVYFFSPKEDPVVDCSWTKCGQKGCIRCYPQKENKTEDMNRLIEEELERQEQKVFKDWNSNSTGILKNIDVVMADALSKHYNIENSNNPFTYNFDYIKLPKEGGVKTNKNKPQLSILFTQFPEALEAIAKCSEYGHLKYKSTDTDYLNYQRVEGGSKTYADAGLRHRLYKKGTTDIESQLPHAYHVAWNALAELQLLIKEN
jgi:hypothetical protein